APLIAPTLVPTTRSGTSPCSSSARSIPTSPAPSCPPPPSTNASMSSTLPGGQMDGFHERGRARTVPDLKMVSIHIAQPEDGLASLARALDRASDEPASLFVVAYDSEIRSAVGMIRVIARGETWELGTFAFENDDVARALVEALAHEGLRH